MSGLAGGRRACIVAAAVGAAAVAGSLARGRARAQEVPADSPADVSFMRAPHAALRRDLSRLEAVAGQLDGTAPSTVLAGWDASH